MKPLVIHPVVFTNTYKDNYYVSDSTMMNRMDRDMFLALAAECEKVKSEASRRRQCALNA